jgi:hypothetical protein
VIHSSRPGATKDGNGRTRKIRDDPWRLPAEASRLSVLPRHQPCSIDPCFDNLEAIDYSEGFMSAYTYRMLLVQGFSRDDIVRNANVGLLARWTPFACGCFGALGLGLRSPVYLWALGILTLIGALGSRSFYDYLYQIFLRPLTGLGEMPRHGPPRRFGCAIGAFLFIVGGTGFYLRLPLLSFISCLIIIPLAFGAAFTQWCFASALYRLISGKKAECC